MHVCKKSDQLCNKLATVKGKYNDRILSMKNLRDDEDEDVIKPDLDPSIVWPDTNPFNVTVLKKRLRKRKYSFPTASPTANDGAQIIYEFFLFCQEYQFLLTENRLYTIVDMVTLLSNRHFFGFEGMAISSVCKLAYT